MCLPSFFWPIPFNRLEMLHERITAIQHCYSDRRYPHILFAAASVVMTGSWRRIIAVALNWDEYATLNTMQGSVVVVSYAPNVFGTFAENSRRAMPSNLMEEELRAPSESIRGNWPRAHETSLSELPPDAPKFSQMAAADSSSATLGILSRRQREVLHLIVQGRSNKEIARALNLAEGTVKIHVAALFGKLGVHRRAALAVFGAGVLSPAM
jgi:DNA-binding CsgD family transcriptional regulator